VALKAQGCTVFFSTHILPDAEALCDRVALLREGRLVEVGPLSQVLRVDPSHMEVLAAGLSAEAVARLPEAARAPTAVGERWRLEVSVGQLGTVATAIEREGGRVLSANPARQTLEEAFLREVGAEAPPS
jgi:ABC-2 type transport system ATP-binding protein